MAKFCFLLLIVFILLANNAFAANVRGNIYSIDLEKISNVKVEINTTPKQVVVAKGSSYEFFVPEGDYEIRAVQVFNRVEEAETAENLTISGEGAYILDLILLPILEDIFIEEIEINGGLIKESKPDFLVVAIIFLFVLIVFTLFILYKKHKEKCKEENAAEKIEKIENELDKIIKIIKDEGGRATQKEIRRKMPYSEAKISLMITELEGRGLVKRIKKGRGNVVVLDK